MVDFHVLRCAQCQTFQVLQVTKSAKWNCKMCGLKQAVMKVYGQGSGADCRRHVQTLNSIRGQISETAEEQHLTSAMQTPVDSGFMSPDNVITKQQETVNGSRWSSFLDEPDDGVEESLLNDDVDDNGAVLPATDWAECRGTSNTWRQRRAERNNRFSKLPGKKSKNFCENISMSSDSDRECNSAQYKETSTYSSVNHASSSSSSSSLFSSKSYAANTLPASSFSTEEGIGNRINSPHQFSTRPKAHGASSLDPHCGYPSDYTHGHDWIHEDLGKNVSVNVLGAKKGRTNQGNTKENCNLTKLTVNSKWDAFLETEQHDEDGDDDDHVTFCDNTDTITDSKLQAANSRKLSLGGGHLKQELQSVGNIQRHSPVHCPRESDLHNNLESKSSDWLQRSKLSDWLQENKNSDWLKESKHSDWLRGSVVKRTTDSNSTHPAVISSSSGCKERGTFDLGLEIFDEDLQL